MNFELFPGVRVNFVKSNQFKSTQIMVSFIKRLTDKKQLATRTLLASMLETCSQKYPNQHALTLKLAELYGATFGTNADVEGNLSFLNFIYSFVDPKYLDTSSTLLQDSISFLNEVIFHPKMDLSGFDSKIFERQKTNLMTYINDIQDNKQSKTLLKVQELYFDDDVQKYSPYGSKNQFAKLTNSQVTAEYHSMIQNDGIQITIMGDLEIDELKKALSKLEFTARKRSLDLKKEICYHQKVHSLRQQVLKDEVKQSKLDLIYQLPIDAQSGEDFFTAVVFNALLGDSPQSKLFKNIREKASLAYYAESSYSALRSVILVQTGIQAKNHKRVMDLIKQQIVTLQMGNFDDGELQRIKIELINERLRMQDNPMSILEQQVLSQILGQDLSYEYQCKAISKVSKQDIIRVANLMKLQAEFFLEGEK